MLNSYLHPASCLTAEAPETDPPGSFSDAHWCSHTLGSGISDAVLLDCLILAPIIRKMLEPNQSSVFES
jgi:hypothetical protein